MESMSLSLVKGLKINQQLKKSFLVLKLVYKSTLLGFTTCLPLQVTILCTVLLQRFKVLLMKWNVWQHYASCSMARFVLRGMV